MKKPPKDEIEKVEQIYYKYRNIIYLIAFNILNDIDLSEDAVQDTIEKILKNIDKINFNNETEEKNYIARIARNASIDVSNKQKRFFKVSGYAEDIHFDKEIADINPEEYIITSDSVSRIVDGIRNMDTKYRDPLILQKFNKHSIGEIARLQGTSERTIHYRIKAAKAQLAALLKKEEA